MIRLSRLAGILVLEFFLLFPRSLAERPAAAVPSPHPALWQVHGKQGTAYLFGSIHVLPPDVHWRTAEIATAIERADVFVFEIPNDAETQARIGKLVAAKGQLPNGLSLRSMLPPASRADFDADLARSHIPLAFLDGKRPWLADLYLVMNRMQQENATSGLGVDVTLMREAAGNGKESRYLETLDTQVALIVPSDPKLELEEFEADLKESRNEKDEFDDLLDAWSHGEIGRIDALLNSEFASHPAAKKALLDDRNRAWARKLETWLGEDKTFFVTVGAGHLTGQGSLVQLLRGDGYRVDGP